MLLKEKQEKTRWAHSSKEAVVLLPREEPHLHKEDTSYQPIWTIIRRLSLVDEEINKESHRKITFARKRTHSHSSKKKWQPSLDQPMWLLFLLEPPMDWLRHHLQRLAALLALCSIPTSTIWEKRHRVLLTIQPRPSFFMWLQVKWSISSSMKSFRTSNWITWCRAPFMVELQALYTSLPEARVPWFCHLYWVPPSDVLIPTLGQKVSLT